MPAPTGFLHVIGDDFAVFDRRKVIDQMPRAHEIFVQNGLEFEQQIIVHPRCAPSRATWFSGLDSIVHQVWENDYGFFDPTMTWIYALQQAGWRIMLFGKWLNFWGECNNPPSCKRVPLGFDIFHAFGDATYIGTSSEPYPLYVADLGHDGTTVEELHYGFDPIPDPADPWYPNPHPDTDYSTDLLFYRAAAAIQQAIDDDVPWVCWIAPAAPHKPRVPANRHASMTFPNATWSPGNWNQVDSKQPVYIKSQGSLDPSTKENFVKLRQVMQSVDWGIGYLHDLLESNNRLEETLEMFGSDNGEFHGEHRFPDGKSSPHNESRHVPQWVFFKDNMGTVPRTIPNLTSNKDWAQTIKDYTGVNLGYQTPDSWSWRPLIEGTWQSGDPWRTELLMMNPRDVKEVPRWRGILTTNNFGELYVHYLDIDDSPGDDTNPGYEYYSGVLQSGGDQIEMVNRRRDPAFAARRVELQATLDSLSSGLLDDIFTETLAGKLEQAGPVSVSVITLTRDVAVGKHIIIDGFGSNAKNVTCTASDDAGNTWFTDDTDNTDNNAMWGLSCRVDFPLSAGQHITILHSGGTVTDGRWYVRPERNLRFANWFGGATGTSHGNSLQPNGFEFDAHDGDLVVAAYHYAGSGGELVHGVGWSVRDQKSSGVSGRQAATQEQTLEKGGRYQVTAELDGTGAPAWRVRTRWYRQEGAQDPIPQFEIVNRMSGSNDSDLALYSLGSPGSLSDDAVLLDIVSARTSGAPVVPVISGLGIPDSDSGDPAGWTLLESKLLSTAQNLRISTFLAVGPFTSDEIFAEFGSPAGSGHPTNRNTLDDYNRPNSRPPTNHIDVQRTGTTHIAPEDPYTITGLSAPLDDVIVGMGVSASSGISGLARVAAVDPVALTVRMDQPATVAGSRTLTFTNYKPTGLQGTTQRGKIISNQLGCTGNFSDAFTDNTSNTNFGPNCEFGIVMAVKSDGDTYRVGCRAVNLGAGTIDTYRGRIQSVAPGGGGGTDTWVLERINDGTPTTIATGTKEWAAFDEAWIKAVDNVVTLWHYAPGTDTWTSVCTFTDTDPNAILGAGKTFVGESSTALRIDKLMGGTAGQEVQNGCGWSLNQAVLALDSDPINQTANAEATSNVQTLTVTLADPFDDATHNAAYIAIAHSAAETSTPGAGFEEGVLSDVNFGAPATSMISAWRKGEDLTGDASWDTPAVAVGLMAEIRSEPITDVCGTDAALGTDSAMPGQFIQSSEAIIASDAAGQGQSLAALDAGFADDQATQSQLLNPIDQMFGVDTAMLDASEVHQVDTDEAHAEDSSYVFEQFEFTPKNEEVAELLRARTRDSKGHELGVFTEDTRPTARQVERLINKAAGDISTMVGDDIPDVLTQEVRGVVAIYTAMLVELSYFPEQTDSDRSAYRQYKEIYDEKIGTEKEPGTIIRAVQDAQLDNSVDVEGARSPAANFEPMKKLQW